MVQQWLLGHSAFLSGLLLYVYVGVFEEVLFRGVLMTSLKENYSKWSTVILTSLIFGAFHIFNASITILSVINIILIGVMLAYLFIKTGSIWASIAAHFTWNFTLGNIFGINVSGVEVFSIIDMEITGPLWVTGGEFGAEGGVICTAVVLLVILYIRFGMKQQTQFWVADKNLK